MHDDIGTGVEGPMGTHSKLEEIYIDCSYTRRI